MSKAFKQASTGLTLADINRENLFRHSGETVRMRTNDASVIEEWNSQQPATKIRSAREMGVANADSYGRKHWGMLPDDVKKKFEELIAKRKGTTDSVDVVRDSGKWFARRTGDKKFNVSATTRDAAILEASKPTKDALSERRLEAYKSWFKEAQKSPAAKGKSREQIADAVIREHGLSGEEASEARKHMLSTHDAKSLTYTPQSGYKGRREWVAKNEKGEAVGKISETHFDSATAKPDYNVHNAGGSLLKSFKSLQEAKAFLESSTSDAEEFGKNAYGEKVRLHGRVCGECKQRIGVGAKYRVDKNNMIVCMHCKAPAGATVRTNDDSQLKEFIVEWYNWDDDEEKLWKKTIKAKSAAEARKIIESEGNTEVVRVKTKDSSPAVERAYRSIIKAGVLEDRSEYTKEDLAKMYGLTPQEADELHKKIAANFGHTSDSWEPAPGSQLDKAILEKVKQRADELAGYIKDGWKPQDALAKIQETSNFGSKTWKLMIELAEKKLGKKFTGDSEHISGWKQFKVKFQPSRNINTMTWTRFAPDQATAEAEGRKAAEREYGTLRSFSVEEVKTKDAGSWRLEADRLCALDGRIWAANGYRDRSDIERNWDTYKAQVAKAVTGPVSPDVAYGIQDENHHSFLQALMELGRASRKIGRPASL